VVAEAGDRPCLLQATVDVAAARAWRDEFPALRDVRRGHLGTIAIRA
jgi:hypothetical protein